MEAPEILYETLRPLDGPPPPSSSSSSDLETLVVYRNLISTPIAQCASPESAAPDYFSLDVNDAEQKQTSNSATPLPPKGPAQISTPASAGGLEGTWFRTGSRFKSPMLQLHKEILDFCDFLSPTREEQESRNAAVASVSNVIKYIWPSAEVQVFGSFRTGLYLPSSDIDVVILGSNVRSPQIGLQALSRALSQRGIAKKIQVIAKARVPIIKFVEKKSEVSFDISFDVDNGPKAAHFIKDAVSKWPALRPLCLILKVFLQQRELNEVYSGGIGSYALLSMLIAMLRGQQDQVPPEHNLGVLLVKFFDMYGCKLNTVDVGVSCNGEGIFFAKSSKGFIIDGRPSLISIEDPQTPDNDIGKNSFNYYQVRSAFAMAFSTLTNAKAILRLGPDKSILSSIIRPDAVLLERKGGSNRNATINNLFPDSGASSHHLLGDQQEIYCNWPLNDDDEEPLPRGNGKSGRGSDAKSSGKKRKGSNMSKGSAKEKKYDSGQYQSNGDGSKTRQRNC
ncbi:uncharacterized protein LOC127266109 [Andrographis paniculata]|uniref:uncharacterized protein LOC127266109 n=1 Tax=Andrographis paniculata TaxID=175694 RepID=UPI0021E7A1A9|nr:uncharacterized protein LOC127266109 [Andrographis paniculata]